MSMYCQIATQFKDENALISALVESGWKKEQIEIYDQATNLYGYAGDKRKDVANIIIRRKFVRGAANDVGFLKNSDGTYTAIISQYDKGNHCNKNWERKLKEDYIYHLMKNKQESKGRTVRRERASNGRQRIIIGGYR